MKEGEFQEVENYILMAIDLGILTQLDEEVYLDAMSILFSYHRISAVKSVVNFLKSMDYPIESQHLFSLLL